MGLARTKFSEKNLNLVAIPLVTLMYIFLSVLPCECINFLRLFINKTSLASGNHSLFSYSSYSIQSVFCGWLTKPIS